MTGNFEHIICDIFSLAKADWNIATSFVRIGWADLICLSADYPKHSLLHLNDSAVIKSGNWNDIGIQEVFIIQHRDHSWFLRLLSSLLEH